MSFLSFYIGSTALALFTAYLYAFHGYERSSRHSEWMKLTDTTPPLTWISILLLSFIPILNMILGLVGLLSPIVDETNLKIDNWLYRTPKEKEEK